MTYPNVFVATPTHACKVYCADRFVTAVLAHAPGAAFHVVCNSKLDVRGSYERDERVTYTHVGRKLDATHFHRIDSVHRRICYTANRLRDTFLDGPGRGIVTWRANSGQRECAIGTPNKLWAFDGDNGDILRAMQ